MAAKQRKPVSALSRDGLAFSKTASSLLLLAASRQPSAFSSQFRGRLRRGREYNGVSLDVNLHKES
jgi:hypothetical protein